MTNERINGRLSLIYKNGDRTPDRLKEFFQQWEDEAITQREAAVARAQALASHKEWRRQRAEAADRAYEREIARLHRQYERKLADRRRVEARADAERRFAEEKQRRIEARARAVRQAELNRREMIWEQSVKQNRQSSLIALEDYPNDQPVKVRFGEFCRPGSPYPWGGYTRRSDHQRWRHANKSRREAAKVMVEMLGQGCRWPQGRGVRSPRKQPRGWEAWMSQSWSRREYVEAKWSHLFD
jgi:hypothetical protein